MCVTWSELSGKRVAFSSVSRRTYADGCVYRAMRSEPASVDADSGATTPGSVNANKSRNGAQRNGEKKAGDGAVLRAVPGSLGNENFPGAIAPTAKIG